MARYSRLIIKSMFVMLLYDISSPQEKILRMFSSARFIDHVKQLHSLISDDGQFIKIPIHLDAIKRCLKLYK